jgi:very-short-patch-repair endonuclease
VTVETTQGLSRKQLVATAVERWAKDLIDTGKRNPLLYYRNLQAGTLSLDDADPAALTAFLAGSQTRLSSLFPAPTGSADALKRIRTIRKKVLTLQEERGIQTGYLAIGMATWTEQGTAATERPPAAPILLREIWIKPRSASESDFDLTLAEEAEYNPVLLHYLNEHFGSALDLSALPDDPDEKSWHGIGESFVALALACAQVPGFATERTLAVGSFSYQKLPMVNDLHADLEILLESDVIAALAGDAPAQEALRGTSSDSIEPSLPDHTPPADEFLVLDADSSQNYAINAAFGGSHVVIKGPPGTGKSQTIANLIAGLMARGKRVLFVAEKRAAIDAVLGRLRPAELDTWVMDLHDGLSNRRRVAQQLADTLERASRTGIPDVSALHRELVASRERLINHSDMMHRPHQPWGFTAYELQALRLEVGEVKPSFRFRGARLTAATPQMIEHANAVVTEYAELDGFKPAEAGAWSGAQVDTADQARQAIEIVRQLRDRTVPDAGAKLNTLIESLGLRRPTSIDEWGDLLGLVNRVAGLRQHLAEEAFGDDQQTWVAATATGRWRKEHGVTMPWGVRRRAVKAARGLVVAGKPSKSDLHLKLAEATELTAAWRAASVDGGAPRLPADLAGSRRQLEQMTNELRGLGAFIAASDLGSLDPSTSLPQRLDALVRDQPQLSKLPRLRELRRKISDLGLDAFVDECRRGQVRPQDVRPLMQAAWFDSILEEISLIDANYGAFQGTTLNRVIDSFQAADTQHIKSAGARVQRAAAEVLYAALDAHPEQALLIRKQANLKRRHMPMRDLIEQAGDVLLAAKPCWAMSPLVVSQVLPMRRMFDVVIFDEASQIPPADAIPSIARGEKLVVAGDERQLPPTSFFGSTSDDSDEQEDTENITLTSGFESILDALAPLISVRNLQWHYRSRDERLIAFSNVHIYDSSLTTFPGAHQDGVLRHAHVPWVPEATGVAGSATAEVERVVDLVIEHAETRPEESLGVIAMGIKHADRIDAAVRERLRDRTDLESFFSEAQEERFFVKNLERVQGDERDAIIMSIGYGKSADGRMLYRFGPINTQGGERRLNVAVSRAKRRMTLVSSFNSADLDPKKLNARGAELLGAYVSFMESGGTDLGSIAVPPPHLNAFEQDIRDRLTKAGLTLTPQFGVSAYRIDFVASHPDKPGQYVLAIEADGASYHSSPTARDRDRLRQEHLERLGWRFHRIWSTDWFRNPQAEVDRVLTAFHAAVAAADRGEATGRRAQPAATPITEEADVLQPSRTLAKPPIWYGEPITAYSRSDLVAIIRWLQSDGLLRTEEDLIRDAMEELGWRRRGSRIDAGLREAIAAVKR